MSGVRCGVQALVKKEESRALYVHCLAHSLNLSIQSAAKNCELIRTTMDLHTNCSSLSNIHQKDLPCLKVLELI